MINNTSFGEFVTYQSASVRKQEQLSTNQHGHALNVTGGRAISARLSLINKKNHSPFAFTLI